MPISTFKSLPLSYKVALIFGTVLLLMMSTLWVLIDNTTRLNLQLQADEVGETLATQTADAVRELVLANDLLGLNVVVGQLAGNSTTGQITVYDVDGEVLSRAGSGPANESGTMRYQADIRLQDAVAGSVQLELDVSELQRNINQMRYYFLGALLFGLLLTIALSFVLASYINSPLNQLSDALEDPDEADISSPGENGDEINRLQRACKNLLKKYQENRSHQMKLSGMLSPESSQKLTQSNKIMASLLVIKVVNVNTAIELLHPKTFSNLLNEYHFYLKQAAKLYGGRLHRYTGESCLVSFDALKCGEEHGLNAICCAQLFLTLMQRINQQHKNAKNQALQFRLAIHSGETFFNFESSSETLLGKSLETAYFLSKQSRPGQLLISETTYSQASKDHHLHYSDSIEITMPTDNMSITAYILSPEMHVYFELIQKQSQQLLPETEEHRQD
jgi:membrane protein